MIESFMKTATRLGLAIRPSGTLFESPHMYGTLDGALVGCSLLAT